MKYQYLYTFLFSIMFKFSDGFKLFKTQLNNHRKFNKVKLSSQIKNQDILESFLESNIKEAPDFHRIESNKLGTSIENSPALVLNVSLIYSKLINLPIQIKIHDIFMYFIG